MYKKSVLFVLLSTAIITGCKTSTEVGSTSTNSSETAKTEPAAKPNPDGTIPSGSGVEREKPSSGKGNVQGKVFYNQEPAPNIEVKLCETFSRFMGGCGGETFTARTDSQGEYLIKDVPPRIYEGLIAKVFDTNYFVFATSGIVQTAKYKIEEGRTFFAPDTHLFKSDLKFVNPKAGAKIDANNIEVKWEPYPDAAYYKFSIHAGSSSGAQTDYDYINKRVDGLSYVLDKPLSPGAYSWKVEAYNNNDIKLAQSSSDVEFTVTGEASK